jgi:hypothetical protein
MAKHVLDCGPISEKTLARLAKVHKTSKDDVIRKAIAVYAGLTDEVVKGNKIMFQSPDGILRGLLD